MNRRTFIKQIGSLSVMSVIPSLMGGSQVAGKRPPNIILILTDDQGFGDSEIHGNSVIRTEHIDKIAKDGLEFTRFYVEPVCAPTRASLMTGRYHYRTGVLHTSRGGAKMFGSETTVAEILSEHGYATGIFGKWHLGDNYPMRPSDQGFDVSLVHKGGGIGQVPDQPNSYFDPLLWYNNVAYKGEGYCTDIFFDEALQFIEKNRDNPFFVYLPTNTPHYPFEIGQEYVTPYLEKDVNERDAKIYGMVTNIDENIGKLVRKLDDLDISRETLLIFITDNGPNSDRYNAGLRRRKGSNYEGGIRALCYMKWPGVIEPGRKDGTLAAHIDILPTLLDICHIEPEPSLQLDGVSLYSHFTRTQGEQPLSRSIIIQSHRGLIPRIYQNASIITEKYKLLGYPDTFREWTLETSAEKPLLELYDLGNDPGESKNLVDDYPEVVNRLRHEYEIWFEDMRQSRQFSPGVIIIDSDYENPVTLCRYQDATYHLGVPHGWPVQINRAGKYEVTMDLHGIEGEGKIALKWQGNTQLSSSGKRDMGTFFLPAGTGMLETWFEHDTAGRITFSESNTIGDVILRKV